MSPLVLGLGAAAGLCVGSFVTTAALRATRGEQFLSGRSHCDGCGSNLNLLQTAPVVSFVGARGVCRTCGMRIDVIHPIGELVGAALGILAVLFPLSPDTILEAALGFCLLAASVVDARTRRLPDVLTAAAALLCLALSLRQGPDHLPVGVAAAGASGLILIGLRHWRAWRGRDPGVGLGDVKLVGALALWLGLLTPWMVFMAASLALVYWAVFRPADARIPTGPMIALAGFGLGIAGERGLWPGPI